MKGEREILGLLTHRECVDFLKLTDLRVLSLPSCLSSFFFHLSTIPVECIENLEKPFIMPLEVQEIGAVVVVVVVLVVLEQDGWVDGWMVSSEHAGDEVSHYERGHRSGISGAS